jgi:microcin C transport system substrate-binding protein
VDLIYDRLMASSPDEPATAYGHIAEWVSYPEDFSSATVRLRASARFHDGKPIYGR